MLINDNSELSQLNERINSENANKESLERLAAYLYNVDTSAKSSVKINEKNGVFYIKDWSGQIAALAAGANFYGLILGATKHLKGTELLAEKRRLYESSTGLSFVAVAGAPANQPAKSQSAKVAANEKKEAPNKITFGGWHTPNGRAIIDYFASKTGANKTDFLERYGVKPIAKVEFGTGKVYTTNALSFCFSYTANDWIKKIQPSAPKELKTLVLNAGANNYVFGLEQLPEKDENLLIFEGESDVICASWHGFNAVCFGGAGKPILEQTAKELKARFKRIFVLFDNDNAGKTNGKELADKHGFIYVDTEFSIKNLFAGAGLSIPENCKDLCDIHTYWSAYNAASAAVSCANFLNLCTGLNGRIYGLANDRFSVPISHAITIPFNQYISEKTTVLDANGQIITVPYIHEGIFNPLQILALSIAKHKRVCLQATAGAGKSTALIDLIKDYFFNANIQSNKLYFGGENAIKRVVIAVPTIPLAEQLYTVFSGKDRFDNPINFVAPFPNCALITGEKSVLEKRASIDSDIIICTYDSVLIAGITENTLLITDEAHQIITENGYRQKATKSVLAAIKQANYTLLLSATPNYLFNENLGFKLVIGVPEITNTKHVDICEYTGKQTELIPYILDNDSKTGTILTKQDDSTLLRAGADYAENLGLTSEVFCGKNDKFRRDNANYKSILETSKLATKVDIIFTTRLIEAGVSIKDEISRLYICDTDNNAKIIQQLARPRFDAVTGANSFINAVLFIQQKTAKEKEKTSFTGTYTASELYAYKLNLAQKKADYLNAGGNDFKDENLSTDAKDYVYQTDEKTYLADEIAIMFDIDNAAITKDKNLIAARLQYTDSSIKKVTFSTLQLSENAVFTERKDAIKSDKQQAQKDAILAIKNIAGTDKDILNFILYKLVTTEKSTDKRIGLTSCLGIPNDKETGKNARAFYQSLPAASREILENADANILGFLSKVADYMKLPNTPIFDAIDKAEIADKADYKATLAQIETLELKARWRKYKSGAAGEKEKNQCETATEIYKAFQSKNNDIQQQKRKPYQVSELVKITNEILTRKDEKRSFKPKTETGKESVLKYLKSFFDVSTKIIDKKTYYILTRKK
jgi:hypothetical protein